MSEKCGTYAGYNAHLRAGGAPCAECRHAATVYARQHRRSRGGTPAPELAVRKALRSALAELTRLGVDPELVDSLRLQANEGVRR